jgi:glycerate kinase
VIAIAGTLGDGYHVMHDHGISAATAIPNAPMTLENASANAADLISDATRQVMRMLKVGGQVFGK